MAGLLTLFGAASSARAAEITTDAPWRALGHAMLALERHEISALALTLSILWFAVLAAILLVRARRQGGQRENVLNAQIDALSSEAERLRTLLFAEPQVLIAWPAGEDRAAVSGDTSLLIGDGPAHRVVAFGTWLAPEPAVALDRAVDALRTHGESFALTLMTLAGRSVEVSGRALGGQAVVRLRELSGARRELAETALRQRAALEEADALRAFVGALPWPVWVRRHDGALAYANAAYVRATDSRDMADAIGRNIELLDRDDRLSAAQALEQGGAFNARMPVIVAGDRRIADVCIMPTVMGSAGIAIDATEAADMGAALRRMADAHRRTLNQLTTGVAVFDNHQRLVFYNDSYRQLWSFDPAFLDGAPSDFAVLDRLRTERKLPEEQDFRQWKARLHAAYQSIEAQEDTWHLPDGRTLRMVTTPNIEGGVTYLFDDVTERLDLARRFDSLIRVQRETLDNLAEGVAVFGSNGRLHLFNPAFARMWKLDPAELVEAPHVQTVARQCVPLFDDSLTWQTLHGAITSIDNRASLALRLDRKDGTLLDCIAIPLPDGATMLTFHDITDTENFERALRERNEALETADQMKVDFVHHVSYELRSPLTTIIGFAHFLNDPATGSLNDKQRDYLGYITTSTNALLAIINNILDLATIDAGAMTLNLGHVDVRKAIEAAAEGIQDRLVTDHIALDIHIGANVDTFVADERRVTQVLYNLLANAAGFSPPESAITVTVERHDDRLAFAVSDCGPGIAPEAQQKVFDWFESNASGSRHRGAGLGLSLVRSFVELHGGAVRVDSMVGKGTTVTCEFPLDQAAQRVAAQ